MWKIYKITSSKGFTIGELILVFFIVFIISGMMLPIINYNHRKLERVSCANNLRQLGLALYIYAREHEGRFPQMLKTLYDEQYLKDRTLVNCPASKSIGTPEEPDYVYFSALTVRDYSMATLVEDKEKNHFRNGKNILHVNGVIDWKE